MVRWGTLPSLSPRRHPPRFARSWQCRSRLADSARPGDRPLQGARWCRHAVFFTADGKTFTSASADTTLLICDLAVLKREPKAAIVKLNAKQIETLWAFSELLSFQRPVAAGLRKKMRMANAARLFTTPASLLERLRKSEETTAWERFVELYTPLLYHWAQRLGLQNSDCADLVQDVFLILWRRLPEFEYDSAMSFHAWLKTLFLNRHRSRQRQRDPIPIEVRGQDIVDNADGQLGDAEYSRYLIRQAFRLIEREFSPLHQRVFRAYVMEERAPKTWHRNSA